MSSMPTAAQRIQAQTRQMQGKDVTCQRCGSEHFYEVQVTRYLAGGSGSVEILADPNEQAPHPLLKCAGCDLAVLPKVAVGRRHGGIFETSHKAFRESVEKGLSYLKTLTPKSLTDDILAAVAGKAVEGQVQTLSARVQTLETALTSTETAKNHKPKEDKPKEDKDVKHPQ